MLHDFIQLQHLIDQLPVGLLAYLVRMLLQCRRGEDLNRCKPEFFQAFFSHCITVMTFFTFTGLILWLCGFPGLAMYGITQPLLIHWIIVSQGKHSVISNRAWYLYVSCLPSRIYQHYRLKACSQLGKIGGSGIRQEQNQLKIEPNYKKNSSCKKVNFMNHI